MVMLLLTFAFSHVTQLPLPSLRAHAHGQLPFTAESWQNSILVYLRTEAMRLVDVK